VNVRRVWIVTTAALVLFAIAVRFVINFSHTYPPGVNAAYYPLQAGSWLLHGRLMYDDLPLIFWVDAGLARAIAAFGMPIHDALLFATRIVDSVFEPFAAVAIMAFGYVWSAGRLRALGGCVAAAMLVVLSPPILRMLSDFEKNSLGLVFMCAALWACRSAMATSRVGSWISLSVVLVLTALTHLGAFAMTLLLVGVSSVVWGVVLVPRRYTTQVVVTVGAASATLLAVVATVDVHRFERLVRAPVALFRSGPIESLELPVIVVITLLVAMALWTAWRDRRALLAADVAIVSALAVVTAILIAPKSYVYFNRLLLMLPVSGSLLLAFVIARSSRADLWAGTALLVLASAAAVSAPASVQRPLMNPDVASELLLLQQRISDADRTLVVAPHGFEWWAGHLLGTRVRGELPAGAKREYQQVLLLRNTADCPPDVVSPFRAPDVADGARPLFAGRYIEVYEAP